VDRPSGSHPAPPNNPMPTLISFCSTHVDYSCRRQACSDCSVALSRWQGWGPSRGFTELSCLCIDDYCVRPPLPLNAVCAVCWQLASESSHLETHKGNLLPPEFSRQPANSHTQPIHSPLASRITPTHKTPKGSRLPRNHLPSSAIFSIFSQQPSTAPLSPASCLSP
jgi:hypothetical protein